ncbi:hypothetical protein [Streptomyces lavendulae]|uniref:hypothetical protein n=1 Tax=Streptomyces lavendulae TaxID=1914 RepID=UPI0036E7AD79
MSDHQDEKMQSIEHRISVVYTGLFHACDNLPIPIGLPQADDAATVMAAVRRVYAIADEQPIPQEQREQLATGACAWLAACDLYGILRTEYEESRAEGALGNLMVAREAFKALGDWILDND